MIKRLISFAIILSALTFTVFAQVYSDAAMARVRDQDKAARIANNGKLPLLTAAEHLYRADVYMSNRAFADARDHWTIFLQNYPGDAGTPKALFGMGRSNMWERNYQLAIEWFDKAIKDYLGTKDGREALAQKGACLVRLGRNEEAAKVYEQYTVMFPMGEKVEGSHLNLIDALREAGKYDEANLWIDKTREKFSGLPTETNAMFARLRMETYRQHWDAALRSADTLLAANDFGASMSSRDETMFLKAFALEKMGRKPEAINAYFAIPDTTASYYGGLATERLLGLTASDAARRTQAIDRTASVRAAAARVAANYPAPFASDLLMYAKPRGIDPRFLLAIMKQESSFRPNAKSPAAARGLLQLVPDTAAKYTAKAGIRSLDPEDLYQPGININLGSMYISELKKEFSLYEGIAASYNGGEDNALRWLNRSKPKEAHIFASEVGFSETKTYVYKVMANYRVYRELYTEDLKRR